MKFVQFEKFVKLAVKIFLPSYPISQLPNLYMPEAKNNFGLRTERAQK